MVPTSQLLSHCTAPKTPHLLTCPIPVTKPVSLQAPIPEQNLPGICCQGVTLLCPQGTGTRGDIVTRSWWQSQTPPCRPCFGELQGENIPSRLFRAFEMCDHTERTKTLSPTAYLPLQLSSKHFLLVNPNLSSFQMLFVGLLHHSKVYQDPQKCFGSDRSPNSSSREVGQIPVWLEQKNSPNISATSVLL